MASQTYTKMLHCFIVLSLGLLILPPVARKIEVNTLYFQKVY